MVFFFAKAIKCGTYLWFFEKLTVFFIKTKIKPNSDEKSNCVFFGLNRWTFQTYMRITETTTLKTTKTWLNWTIPVSVVDNSTDGNVCRMMMNGMRIAWGFIILLSLFVVWIHTHKTFIVLDRQTPMMICDDNNKNACWGSKDYTHTHAITFIFFPSYFRCSKL